jgi:hypothetical protein
MPVIPISQGARAPAASQPVGPQPSEAQLLMALAEMHKQGRLKPKAESDA